MNNKNLKLISETIREKMMLVDFSFFYFLLMLSCLYLFTNPIMSLVGSISIILIFILSLLYVVFNGSKVRLYNTWKWFEVFMVYSIIMTIRTFTLKSVYSGILQIMMLVSMCIYSNITIEKSSMNKVFKLGKITFLILLIPAMLIVIMGEGFGIFGFNKYFSPTIYKIMLPCTFFFIVNFKKKLPMIIIFSLLFLLIGERTSALCLCIIYCVYLILDKVKESKCWTKGLFYIVFILIVLFPFIYVGIQYTDLGNWLNVVSFKYTHENFFSGRHVIWKVALQYFWKSPILGYGIDNRILYDSGINVSTHNLYLYILLQGGIVGLATFFFFIRSVWIRLIHNLSDEWVRMSTSYLIGILILASFELILIVNAVTVSMFLWLIIGIGLIQSNKLDRDKNNLKI